MRFEPFLLEDWLIECLGARIDLDHSGAPAPWRDGLAPQVEDSGLNEFEVEDRFYKAISSTYRVRRSRIALTSGAQSANYAFLDACLGRGAKVMVEHPTYAPMRACAKALCAQAMPLPRPREKGFTVDMAALDEGLRQGAQAIILTNLHNPSAKALRDGEMEAILEAAEDKGALVLVDEVYREMCPRPPKAAFRLSGAGVSTDGMSKLFGLGKLRVGWLIGPEEVAERVNETRLYSSWHLPSRSMETAIQALERKAWFRERALRIAKVNLPTIMDWAEEEGIEVTEPDGCLHMLVHLPPGTDDEAFARRLLRRHSTAVCPGRYFGAEGSFRITFSCDGGTLQEGLGHVAQEMRRLGQPK
ncbi:MAG: pyridoxal phosphate-dependent aminotransferase [Methanomassiliicoccales archaeon]|nr:pyridoxal phosphate-dependent aminotransferase [Methanomassiliicoccales archaeon]